MNQKRYNILIINENFLKTDYIEENSTDLVVTSPLYNVDINYIFYNDLLNYDKYLEFTDKWLEKA